MKKGRQVTDYEAITSNAFEEAAKEYRNAIRAADRLRTAKLVGMYRAAQGGIEPESLRPTDEELQKAEERIEKARERLSEAM